MIAGERWPSAGLAFGRTFFCLSGPIARGNIVGMNAAVILDLLFDASRGVRPMVPWTVYDRQGDDSQSSRV
jgi:hypothetical protein